jgi:hypothetical protein
MWRLMFAMIVVSNNGDVAVNSQATDWPSQQVCEEMIRTLYSTPETSTIGGMTLTIKTNAQCVPVGGSSYAPPQVRYESPAQYAPPPPRTPGNPRSGEITFGPFSFGLPPQRRF